MNKRKNKNNETQKQATINSDDQLKQLFRRETQLYFPFCAVVV